jgi:hypothetical protein
VRQTHSFPVKAMGNPILGLLRARSHLGRNMLNLGSIARRRILRTAIVNMDVPSKVCAVKVAHHRSAVIVSPKLVPIDFKGRIFWSFD